MGEPADKKDPRSVFVSGHHKSFVTQSGLVAVLQHVRKHGLPSALSRRTVKRDRSLALPRETPLGPLWGEIEVEMLKGPNKKYPMINPMALLWFLCTECVGFRDAFRQQVAKHQPSLHTPHSVCIYQDEVLPGNPLRVTNERKLQCWYWSIAELGYFCGDEDFWLHILAVRTSEVKKIKSGTAQLFKLVVEKFFAFPYSMQNGVMLPLGETTVMWHGRMAVILGDEVALKNCLSFKGAAGTLPCPLCRNVCQWASDLHTHDHSGFLIPHTESDTALMVPHTADSIREAMNLLRTQHSVLSKSKFEALEKNLGLLYQPEGAMYDDQFHSRFLRGPLGSLQFDWMHCYCVSGAMNHEIGLMMSSLEGLLSHWPLKEYDFDLFSSIIFLNICVSPMLKIYIYIYICHSLF